VRDVVGDLLLAPPVTPDRRGRMNGMPVTPRDEDDATP
jgi:hypothetical protein